MNTPLPDNDVVAAMFESRPEAEAARAALVVAGIDHGAIEIVDQAAGDQRALPGDPLGSHGIWHKIREMLVPHEHAHGYAEGIERGHATLFVRAPADRQADVMAVLEQQHPIDVMHRVTQWSDSGWNGVHRSQAPVPPEVGETGSPPMLFGDRTLPDHMRATGLLNDDGAGRGIGAPLLNPMGIAVTGMRVTGSGRVRRYQGDPDALPVDDV